MTVVVCAVPSTRGATATVLRGVGGSRWRAHWVGGDEKERREFLPPGASFGPWPARSCGAALDALEVVPARSANRGLPSDHRLHGCLAVPGGPGAGHQRLYHSDMWAARRSSGTLRHQSGGHRPHVTSKGTKCHCRGYHICCRSKQSRDVRRCHGSTGEIFEFHYAISENRRNLFRQSQRGFPFRSGGLSGSVQCSISVSQPAAIVLREPSVAHGPACQTASFAPDRGDIVACIAGFSGALCITEGRLAPACRETDLNEGPQAAVVLQSPSCIASSRRLVAESERISSRSSGRRGSTGCSCGGCSATCGRQDPVRRRTSDARQSERTGESGDQPGLAG